MDCFFFSSRRRHTRYWRDWSSDVCSSDLVHRIHVTQYVAQPLIGDEMGHETVGRPRKFGAMGVHMVAGSAQIEEVYLVYHIVKGRHVAGDGFLFVRKLLGKIAGEGLPSLGHVVGFTIR